MAALAELDYRNEDRLTDMDTISRQVSSSTSGGQLSDRDIWPTRSDISSRPSRLHIVRQGTEVRVATAGVNFLTKPFRDSIAQLAGLLALPHGWNSYDSEPIDPKNVKAAINLLFGLHDNLSCPPSVVPRVRGGIQMEWHTVHGDIEIYIDSPSQIRFFAENFATGLVIDGDLTDRQRELADLVSTISPR